MSLKKVTAVVAIITAGALMTNANANDANALTSKAKAEMGQTKSHAGKFNALVKRFDKDNNGLLSKEELKASNKTSLVDAFDKIDTNADSGISEEELAQYLASVSK